MLKLPGLSTHIVPDLRANAKRGNAQYLTRLPLSAILRPRCDHAWPPLLLRLSLSPGNPTRAVLRRLRKQAYRCGDVLAMNEVEGRLGRALLLRFDAGQPLTALSPAWAALCGLLFSGGMHLDARTLVLSVLLLLLVEPVMGGLWQLVVNTDAVANQPAQMVVAEPELALALPYTRPGSAGYQLAAGITRVLMLWRRHGWDTVAALVTLVFALALGSVLGQALLGVASAVLILLARLHWRTGMMQRVLQTTYDLALPWLMGMVALGQIAEQGQPMDRWGLALAAIYALAYVACTTLADDNQRPALLVLDGAQLVVLALLLNRQQTLAIWLFGLCMVGQLAAHPDLLAGGRGSAYLRRTAPYIVVGMLTAAIALASTVLAPTLSGL